MYMLYIYWCDIVSLSSCTVFHAWCVVVYIHVIYMYAKCVQLVCISKSVGQFAVHGGFIGVLLVSVVVHIGCVQ